MPIIRIDRRSVAALKPGPRPIIYFDEALKGFGVRVTPNNHKTYIIEYRPGSGGRGVNKRRLSLGRDSDAFRADAARDLARKELARIISMGIDPARSRSEVRAIKTVGEVIAYYIDNHIEPLRKPRTATLFRGYERKHLAGELSRKKADTITRADVSQFHRRLGKRHPVTANRCVSLIRAAYAYACKEGLLPEAHRNPAAGLEMFRENGRERYLTAAELTRLGETLERAETDGLAWEPRPEGKAKHAPKAEHRLVVLDVYSVAAVRLLLFTGARLREILHLKWKHVDLDRGLLNLPDSKTGKKVIILGSAALRVLADLDKIGDYVIPGFKRDPQTRLMVPDGDRPRADLNRPWARITEHAKLDGLRLHDLRHSFASVGAGSGLGLPIIGRLLGHASAATTARYAHIDADPLRRATDLITGVIDAGLRGPPDA